MSELLHYPSDWFINEKTLEAIKQSVPVMDEFYEGLGVEDPIITPLHQLIEEPLKEVYTIPVFSEVFCKLLLEIVSAREFKPNDEEDELRQIPEFILDGLLYQSLMQIVHLVLNPIFVALWSRSVWGGSIQVANYNIQKTQGAWHHDESADITVVVPLNTGEYEGGGTEFFNRGIVEPLPNGTALIFPSLTHLHRGLKIKDGNRYLLVFWLRVNERNTHSSTGT